MKKLFLLIALAFCLVQSTNAQFYISTSSHVEADFNALTESFDQTGEKEIEKNLFEIDVKSHNLRITSEIGTFSFSLSDMIQDKDANTLEFKACLDDDPQYYMLIDMHNKILRLMHKNNSEVSLIEYNIDKTWVDE